MKRFHYAQPRSEQEAVSLLATPGKETVALAGGTDLVGLLKRMVVTPDLVVNVGEIRTLQDIDHDAEGNLWIGAAVHLDEFLRDRRSDPYASAKQVIQGISSIQLQAQGTLIGELLRRPNCWYFRDGHGLLAKQGTMVIEGANRYHAILGNRGPAKFVNASRLAPALISLGARLRVIGPEPDQETFLDLADLYRTPTSEGENENVLAPGQLVSHLILPPHGNRISAAYEVRHGEGPDPPLASAAVSLDVRLGRVQEARIVLGQVAPVPWVAAEAAAHFVGKTITEESAEQTGVESVAGAIALSENDYKIQLAQVAVKRAILRAAGLETGGLDGPMPQRPVERQTEPTPLV
mgnify:CR=1 FL=1